ncbi:MAG: hypothetical protein JO051_18025 [Acidobacteriaceae bacterium]|nr:hypothetical protein [Acidobacteriaceae bacterium]
MSISDRKLEANRANAQKSSGPATQAGLEKSSRNAVKHGLTGCFRVLPYESQEDFDYLLNEFVEAEKPVGAVEFQLVRKMAEFTWLGARCVRMQEGCITETQTPEQKAAGLTQSSVSYEIDRYIRYQAAHDRAYQRASKELQDRRKQRLIAERGFVSQKRTEADQERKAELHQYKVAAAKAHAGAAESRATIAAIKAAESITSFLPPEAAEMAANGTLSRQNGGFQKSA